MGSSDIGLPKRGSRLRVVQCQAQGLPHQSGGTHGKIQPGQMRMRKDFPDAAPLFADKN
jgi:hypothetical protein